MAQLPRRIAVAFHGEFLRPPPRCSDFFALEMNVRSHLLAPLSDVSSIWTYVSTVSSGSNATDARYLATLRPRAHRIWPRRMRVSYMAYIDVLQLVLNDEPRRVDAVVLTRPDLHYAQPVTQMPIAWHKTNYLFREQGASQWKMCNMTSDLFLVSPLAHIAPLLDAIRWSGETPDFGVGGFCTAPGMVHFTYTLLAMAVGTANINFLSTAFCGSTPHYNLQEDWPECRRFVHLDRTCPGGGEHKQQRRTPS